jgi:hypothetical protein
MPTNPNVNLIKNKLSPTGYTNKDNVVVPAPKSSGGSSGGSGGSSGSSSSSNTLTGGYVAGKGFVTNTGKIYPTTNPNFVPSGYTSTTGTNNVYVSGGKVKDASGSSYVGNAIVPGTGKTANQITRELQTNVTKQLGITPSFI